MNVEVHIDRLVVDGALVAEPDSSRFRAALVAALSEQLGAEAGLAPAPAAHARLAGGAVDIPPAASPTDLAAAVATSVVGAIFPGPRQ